ncbi:hypothetical protein F2P81_013348 [Scophthalmus maximus]|uniref:Uncharacterized protein n=1 Tax=Scophthalmus maximus TaxID=52904 RepID=A0A6A4SUM3_SCOMX|nr:hypothetical protein F2P81_013348 [Scophthalmus maximus]
MEISEYRCDVTSVSVCVTMLSSVVTINFLPPPVASGFELDPEPPPLSEPSRTEPDPRVVRSRFTSSSPLYEKYSTASVPIFMIVVFLLLLLPLPRSASSERLRRPGGVWVSVQLCLVYARGGDNARIWAERFRATGKTKPSRVCRYVFSLYCNCSFNENMRI